MKVVFEFNGRETAKIGAVMAALGVSVSEATIESPKPKQRPRASRSKPEPKPEPEPSVQEPVDTRLEDKESKPEPKSASKPKGGGGRRKFKKLPKETWQIADCLFVGMFVAGTGRECGIAGVETDETTGKVRLAFIDKECETASTEARWFVDPADVLDRMEATKENAKLIKTVYN